MGGNTGGGRWGGDRGHKEKLDGESIAWGRGGV